MIRKMNDFTGQKARAYLSQRKVHVIEHEPFPASDYARIKIAYAIADEPLFVLLVKNIVKSRQDYWQNKVPLPAPADPSSVSRLKILLDDLVDCGMVPRCQIEYATHTLVFRKHLTNEQYDFLAGIWLEYYVGHNILEVLKEIANSGVECDFLFRAKFGERARIRGEIDCLALIDAMPILVEAKSSHERIATDYVSKYASLASRVGASPEATIIVILTEPNLTKDTPVTMVPCKRFPVYFDRIAQKCVRNIEGIKTFPALL